MVPVEAAYPLYNHWDQREPEEQVEVRPHDATADMTRDTKQLVVVVPVNPDEGETQDVDEQLWQAPAQRSERPAERCLEAECSDGDDDGHNPVAEGLQPTGADVGFRELRI